jgi:hypothetical protein
VQFRKQFENVVAAFIEGNVIYLRLEQLKNTREISVHEFIVVGNVTVLKLVQPLKACPKFVIPVAFEGNVISNKLEHPKNA